MVPANRSDVCERTDSGHPPGTQNGVLLASHWFCCVVRGGSRTCKLLFVIELATLLRHGSKVRVLPRSPRLFDRLVGNEAFRFILPRIAVSPAFSAQAQPPSQLIRSRAEPQERLLVSLFIYGVPCYDVSLADLTVRNLLGEMAGDRLPKEEYFHGSCRRAQGPVFV